MKWPHMLRLELLEVRTVPSFIAPRNYEAGYPPIGALAVGDVNGDGVPDLVTGNDYTNSLAILSGNGDGTFQDPRTIPLGFSPGPTILGDFNGDGHLDIATTDISDNTVGILFGNGDGTFRSVQTFSVNYPLDLVAGHFHDQGALDLAVLTNYGVNILLGNGDGTFRPPVYYPMSAGGPLHSLNVADLKGNGISDIFVGNFGTVSVLFGNGDGTFSPVVNYPTGPGYVAAVRAGDLTGHHTLDLVSANGSAVDVLRGNGDGTFQAPVEYAVPASALALADFNGDGNLDILAGRRGITSAGDPSGGLSLLLGNGDGTFQPSENMNLGPVYSLVAADFNGDGIPDIAFNTGGFIVGIRLGNGDGTFQAAPTYATGNHPVAEAVGDFNGDGNADLAVVNQGDYTVGILLGNGDGTFQTGFTYAVGSKPAAIAVGDFNGDGIPDLAVANQGDNTVSILYGNGDGTFQNAVSLPVGSQPIALAAGDLNGDGFSDLVVANSNSNSVSILVSNGDGTFQPAQNLAVQSIPLAVALADVNGDGSLDLLVATKDVPPRQPGGVGVFFGNGDGTFGPGTYYGNGAVAITVGDLNGDGLPDFVTGNTIWLNNGDGTFTVGSTVTLGTVGSNYLETLADVNGDGILDLVAGGVDGLFQQANAPYISSSVKVLLGNGDGTFQANGFAYAAGQGYGSVAVGDFNNDGFADLVTANTVENSVSILLNTADGTGPVSARGGAGRRPLSHAVAVPRVLTAADLPHPAAPAAPRVVLPGHGSAAVASAFWAVAAWERADAVGSSSGGWAPAREDGVTQPSHHAAVDDVLTWAWLEDLALNAMERG